MAIMDTVRKHPYLTAGGVFVVGVILIMVLFSGETSSAPTVVAAPDNTAELAANTQISMATIAAQAQAGETSAALQAQMAGINAQLEIAKLENARGSKSDDLAAAIAQSTATANFETQKLISTLTANVQLEGMKSQERMLNIQSATTISLADITREQLADQALIYSDMINRQTESMERIQLGVSAQETERLRLQVQGQTTVKAMETRVERTRIKSGERTTTKQINADTILRSEQQAARNNVQLQIRQVEDYLAGNPQATPYTMPKLEDLKRQLAAIG